MEQKLKERVVGAALLVLAGVIFIPWLLDGRERQGRVEQSLELPRAPANSAQTRTIVLDASHPAAVESAAAPVTPPVVANPPADNGADARVAAAPAPAVAAQPPEPVPQDRSPPAVSADPAAGWAVQVGSFSSQSNAQRLAEQLEGLGYKAFVSRKVVNDRVMYRVRVGPEPSRDAAEGLALRLREDRQPASIVEHPG